MDDIEYVVAFFELIEKKDWDLLKEMISDDFRYYGPTPDPIGKGEWLDFQCAVQAAFPDWAYNIQKVERIQQAVEITVSISGTHMHELNLPIEGVNPIPATNRKVHMPLEHALLKVKGGKISELRIEQQVHGGLPGLLEQLGVS